MRFLLQAITVAVILAGCTSASRPTNVEEAQQLIDAEMSVEQVQALMGNEGALAIKNDDFEMHEWELKDGTVITVSFSKGKAFRVHEGGFMLGDDDTGAFSSAYSKE